MEHTRKVYIKPQVVQTSKQETKFAKPETRNPFQRLENLLKIVLRIASVKGYKESGQIRGVNGQYLAKSSIVQLLNHSVKKSKLIAAENDFVYLLKEANVPPDLITNENVKTKLIELQSVSSSLHEGNTSFAVQRTENVSEPSENVSVKPVKRNFEDSDDENNEKVIKKPAVDWITADGISSDDEY